VVENPTRPAALAEEPEPELVVWRGICLQEQERKARHPKGCVGRV